jgi:hypothetical protein
MRRSGQMAEHEEMDVADEATGAGSIVGFQVPLGIKKRKPKVDELLRRHSDIDEGHVLSYLTTLDESEGEAVGRWLDLNRFDEVAGWVREHVIREVVANKMREVVRKKGGGSGYALYSPNMGKKRPAKEVGNFPTKTAAKRAELNRFPPKDPQKLARLRKSVQRMAKKPDREQPKTKKPAKHEGVVNEASFPMHNDPVQFFNGLKSLPKVGPQRGQYITQHMSNPSFLQSLQNHPQGKQIHQQLMGFLNSPQNAGPKVPGKVTVQGMPTGPASGVPSQASPPPQGVLPASGQTPPAQKKQPQEESILRKVISTLIRESLFREERSGSAWDEVIGRLSSKALTGDKKFQNLQRNIEKKTQSTLEAALAAINKGVKDKHTKVFGHGVKHSPEAGKIYLPFNVELDDVEVGPIAIYIENGVPRVELSDEAKVLLSKADPGLSKELRANLILTQERVLDRMEDLTAAIEGRDRYLEKLEDGIDTFVAGLSSLQLSLLKKLLVQKYRKNM